MADVTSTRCRGLSLLELLAVLVLLGLLSGLVAPSLLTRRQMTDIEALIGDVRLRYQTATEHAGRFGRPLMLLVDVSGGRIDVEAAEPGSGPVGTALVLPTGWRFERMLIGEREVHGGRVNVACSSEGRLHSHGLLVSGPDREQLWLMVVGGSGAVMEVPDENSIQNALALETRPDTD